MSDASSPGAPTRTRSRTRTEAEFTVPARAAEVRARLERAVAVLPQFAVRALDADAALLTRRVNLLTWGEVVTIRWADRDGLTEVVIQADLRFPTVFGDHGQAGRDVDALIQAMLQPAESP